VQEIGDLACFWRDVGYAALDLQFSAIIAVNGKLGVKARVSHISQETSEIWGTHRAVAVSTVQGNTVGCSAPLSQEIQASALACGDPNAAVESSGAWRNPSHPGNAYKSNLEVDPAFVTTQSTS
jgi:hypothetical protein